MPLQKTVFFLLSFLVFATPRIQAQSYSLKKFSDHNGISSRIVRVAFQDQDGFLWVGGTKGLFKYDGISFQSFYQTPKDTSGFRADKINDIQQTKDGVIWIATTNGLHRIVNNKVQYHPLKSDRDLHSIAVNKLMVDDKDRLWVGTGKGLFILEKKQETDDYLIPHLLTEKMVWGISPLSNGRVIVATPSKIYLFKKQEAYDPIPLKLAFGDGVHFKDTYIFNLSSLAEDTLIAESGKGLHKVNLEGDSMLLIDRFYNKMGKAISKEFIYDMHIDASKTIWLATWTNQFKKYKYQEGLLEALPTDLTSDQQSYISNHVLSITEDRQQNIWMSTASGLIQLSKSTNTFRPFPEVGEKLEELEKIAVNAISMDGDSMIWIADREAVYRFSKSDLTERTKPNSFLKHSDVYTKKIRKIYRDSKNRLWLCTGNGLHVYNIDLDGDLNFLKSFTVKDGLKNNIVTDIIEMETDHFMVANYEALIDLKIPKRHFDKFKIDFFRHKKNETSSINGDYIFSLFKDNKSNLWISTSEGLSIIKTDSKKGVFTNFTHQFGDTTSLSSNAIKNFFQDSKGHIWIGTQAGLNLYQEATNSFLQLGRAEGLPSDYILGIQEDAEAHLWFSTTSGLFQAKYHPEGQRFFDKKYFTVREGLLDNINNINTLIVDEHSNVFVGSGKGLSIKNSQDNAVAAKAFKIQLKDFKSTKKNKSGFHPIDLIEQGETIELGHKENSIKVQYVALDLSRPEFNLYRHKLLPLNNSWTNTNNRSDLDFYELMSGNYQLILDAKNPDGDWQQQPYILNFVVKPPWWKSNWAYVLYGLLIAGLSRFLFVMRINKRIFEVKQEAKLQEALLQEREQMRSENAADFHDELGSSLTKISMYLTLAERSAGDAKDQQKWLDKIRANAKALSGSFRDLLWVIDPQKDSLEDLYLRLKTFGEELFEGADCNFTTVKPKTNLKIYKVDPQIKKQVILVFKEGLTNAAKVEGFVRKVILE